MESPEFKVQVKGVKPYQIKITTSDLIQWDQYRIKNKLPQMEECTAIWSARITYTASIREKKIEAGMPYSVFVDDVEKIEFVGSTDVDPTSPTDEGSS